MILRGGCVILREMIPQWKPLVALVFVGFACDGHKRTRSYDADGGTGTDAGGQSSGPAATADGSTSADDAMTVVQGDAGGRDASSPPASGSEDGGQRSVRLPPTNGGLDYQLYEPYALPSGVTIVSRDKSAPIAAGAYNICYVNGFQTQPEEAGFWTNEHPELLLRDQNDNPVEDPEWEGEYALDITTPAKRAALTTIERKWFEACAAAGYDAVEVDNLDTYSRFGGRIAENDAVAFVRGLADIAHALGMAIAQKNAAEIVGRRVEMGTDFVVSEECNRWDECDVYTEAYGSHVLMIEYRKQDFDKGCADYPNYSVVLRNLLLTAPGSSEQSYVFDDC
jgi:Glycoside-hydrolase family GH114